jgi:hypothetical protein
VLGTLPAIKPPFAALAVVSLNTKLGTILYLGSLVVLGAGFLLATRREERLRIADQNKRDQELYRRLDEIKNQRTLKASVEAHARAVELAGVGVAGGTGTAALTVLPSLKHRALALADEILRFLLVRQSSEPPLPTPATWKADTDMMLDYSKETMGLYSQKFGARALALWRQLSEAGFKDRELDRFIEHPTNPIGIRIVGERLGALAEQMPDA